MAQRFAKRFYSSKQWQRCRQSYIERRITIDGGMCEICKKKTGYIVHHKQKLTPYNINNPDITLNFNNLRYECKTCHDEEEEHAFIRRKKMKCSFGDDGQPIPLLNNAGVPVRDRWVRGEKIWE